MPVEFAKNHKAQSASMFASAMPKAMHGNNTAALALYSQNTITPAGAGSTQ